MVAIQLKRLAALEGKGRTVRDLVHTFIDRYNIAPTQNAVTIHAQDGQWIVQEGRWGLIPSWAKDESVGVKLINARAETIQEKPSFRQAFKRSRLVIPVSGFYEWAVFAGKKRPYYIHPADGPHWFLAGLGETWKAPDGPLQTFTVVTTEANAAMSELHHRMPVILSEEALETWLDPQATPADLQAVLRPCPDGWIESHEVGAEVGNVNNQGATLIEPVV